MFMEIYGCVWLFLDPFASFCILKSFEYSWLILKISDAWGWFRYVLVGLGCICALQELSEVNAMIARAAVTQKLDAHPMMQGILVRCLRRLDKESRGITSNRGRTACLNETEHRLVQDAALSLAVASGANRRLLVDLGQNARSPTIQLHDLPGMSLPNPMLALMCEDQLSENATLVDQLFGRLPTSPAKRLVVAVDCTYLLRAHSQMKYQGVPGLVGGPWSPTSEAEAFLNLDSLPDKAAKAPVMLEAVTWDPAAARRSTFSLASMPMSLAAQQGTFPSKTHAGNHEALINIRYHENVLHCFTMFYIVLLCFTSFHFSRWFMFLRYG